MISRTSELVLKVSAVVTVLTMAGFAWLWHNDELPLWALPAPLLIFFLVMLVCFFLDRKRFADFPRPLSEVIKDYRR